jgi:tetratricopeptide (TPR) repeat protein
MKRVSSSVAALIGLLVGLAAAPAQAEPVLVSATTDSGRSEQDTQRAKELFEQGAQAFAQRRNVEAVYYFRRAAALVPSAEFSYNIGLAYEDMGDIGHALAAYREFLRDQTQSERRHEVEQRMLALEQRLAGVGLQQLSVRSEPAGSTVIVDDKPMGITPWSGELPPGPHRIQVRAPGYRSTEAEVQLAADRASDLNLVLPPVDFNGSGYAPDPAEAHGSGSDPVGKTLGWALVGTGTAALLGGILFEVSRASSQSSADDADNQADAERAQGAADGKQMASLVLLGLGGGLTVSGGLLLTLGGHLSSADEPVQGPAPRATRPAPKLLPPSPRPAAAAVSVGCAPLFCGASARGTF